MPTEKLRRPIAGEQAGLLLTRPSAMFRAACGPSGYTLVATAPNSVTHVTHGERGFVAARTAQLLL